MSIAEVTERDGVSTSQDRGMVEPFNKVISNLTLISKFVLMPEGGKTYLREVETDQSVLYRPFP